MKFLRDPFDRDHDDDPTGSAIGCIMVIGLLVIVVQVWQMAHGHSIFWPIR